MYVTLRPINLETDYPRLAELESLWDVVPVSADELRHIEATHAAGSIFHRVVAANEDDWIAGTAKASHDPREQAGRFFVVVIVDPVACNQGIGTILYDAILAFVREHGAISLESIVGEASREALAFARKRGFTIQRHLYESALDVTAFDHSRFAGTVADVESTGVRFFTRAGLEGTAEEERTLYELYTTTAQDTPGEEPHSPLPLESFRRDVLESPTFLPEGLIIAANGDRWVGVTHLVESGPDLMYNQFTGVLRPYRGRHSALALKLLSIEVCRKHRVKQVKTMNDSLNVPMLAINRKLGYTREPGAYTLRKDHM